MGCRDRFRFVHVMTVIFGFRGIVSQMPIYHSLLVFSLFRRITMGSLSAEDSSVVILTKNLVRAWRRPYSMGI